jgi:hypothetical protein
MFFQFSLLSKSIILGRLVTGQRQEIAVMRKVMLR